MNNIKKDYSKWLQYLGDSKIVIVEESVASYLYNEISLDELNVIVLNNNLMSYRTFNKKLKINEILDL